jgi:hypothetical protein
MILSLSGICLENLPTGLLRRTSIDGARAQSLIEATAAADRLIGVFEFGPVPDPKAEKTFGQLLDALRGAHGIELDPKAFYSEVADDPDDPSGGPSYFANPLQVFRADADRPILVVDYVFTPGREDFLDMDVVSDRLTFDLIEVAGEAVT